MFHTVLMTSVDVRLLYLLLCVNVCAENPAMRSADIDFALSVILHTLVPPIKQQVTPSGGGGSTKRHLSVSDSSRTASVMSHHARSKLTAPGDTLQTIAFLGELLFHVHFPVFRHTV